MRAWFFLLAFALVSTSCPNGEALAASDKQAWLVEQKHSTLGPLRFLVSSTKLKVETVNQGNVFIADSATQNLDVFNHKTKRHHSEKLSTFKPLLSSLTAVTADYDVRRASWREAGNALVFGAPVKVYRQAPRVIRFHYGTSSYLPGKKDKTSYSAAMFMSSQIELKPVVSKFLAMLEAVPDLGGLPMRFERKYGDQEAFKELDTQKIERISMKEDSFKVPRNYKEVWSCEAVTAGDNALLDQFLNMPER